MRLFRLVRTFFQRVLSKGHTPCRAPLGMKILFLAEGKTNSGCPISGALLRQIWETTNGDWHIFNNFSEHRVNMSVDNFSQLSQIGTHGRSTVRLQSPLLKFSVEHDVRAGTASSRGIIISAMR